MPKAKETVLEIDLKALAHNYNYLRSILQPQTKFMAVVKAFAYGTDAETIALKLQDLGVDYFAVAYTNEGVALRDAGVTKPILVLHPQPIHFKTIIERCLEPNMYSFKILNDFIRSAEADKQTNYPVHIKFNTGLNRLGFKPLDANSIITQLRQTKAVKPVSLFSHLAASEDLNEAAFTTTQIDRFNTISERFKTHFPEIKTHLCNTSGILNYPQAHCNMVRSGIGLYGFGNDAKHNANLKPIACLKSVVSQIHDIAVGESVGYNRAFVADKPMQTATIPLGHADGINRIYGHRNGFVYINNQKADIVGNVCMDMIMVDVTNLDCQEGDEVIIFNGIYTAENLAENAKTISYELITSVSRRVKRTFCQ